jgi:flagellar basal body-associated protein FliL
MSKPNRKKTLKIILIAILVLVVATVSTCGIFLYHIDSTKKYCSNYATEQAKNAESPDRRYAELQDLCMRDKGLSGF